MSELQPMLEMIKQLREDVKELDKKVDELLSIKWKIAGGSIVLCTIIVFLMELTKLSILK
jgi:iron uptake system EfeUOB component EfeO/EfeM